MTARTNTTAQSAKPTAAQMAAAKADIKAQQAKRTAAPEAAPVEDRSMFEGLNFDFRSFCESMGIELPSKTRVLVSLVASVVVASGIAYFGGQLLGMLVAGALVLTGSAFLSLLIYILGLCVLAYGAFVAGRKVAQYILTSNVDSDVAAVRERIGGAKDRVLGWFKSEPKVVAAPAAQ